MESHGRAVDDGVMRSGLPIGDTTEVVIASAVMHSPTPTFGFEEGSRVPEQESELV